MRKILFIVNPVAGNGTTHSALPIIKEMMNAKGIEYDIKVSKYKGDVANLGYEGVSQEYSDIVCIGGDGTLTELISGIDKMDDGFNKVKIGMIPFGTGNDYAKSIGLSSDVESAIHDIVQGDTKKFDIGFVNGRPFLNVVSFGIDGQIIMDAEKVKKIIPGSKSYIIAALKSIMSYRPFSMKISVVLEDGSLIERNDNYVMVAVGNGKYFGGGMDILPKSIPDDGLLDLCLIRHMNNAKLLSLFPTMMKGMHLSIKEVEYHRCTKVSIESVGKEFHVNSDGNLIGMNRGDVSLHKDKVEFIVKRKDLL